MLVFRAVRNEGGGLCAFPCLYANPAALRLTHEGAILRDSGSPEHHRLLGWARQVEGGGRVSEDLPCVLGGSERILHVDVAFSQECLLVWVRDVTAERREAEALRQSRALFHSIIEGTTDAVFAKDAQGRYTLINSAGAQALGRTPQAILGHTDLELFPFPEGLATVGHDQTVLASGCTLTYEDVETSGRVWLSTKGVLRNAAGHVAGLFGISRDITARKRLEEERAREAQLRERFMSILAHDLGNPLAVIRLTTHMLLSVGGLTSPQHKALTRIESSTERIAEMTRQLLDFTHVRCGEGLPVTIRPVNLEAVCHRVIAEFRVTHPERLIQLAVEGEAWGSWDELRLAQALSNLLGNALDHGDAASPVFVRAWDEGDVQRLEVHNTGAPIPPELLPRLFDPFRRGTKSQRGRSGGGLGLGLYIVREIARAHRGTVEVRSSAEEGTVFTLVLPRGAPLGIRGAPRRLPHVHPELGPV